MCCELRFVFTRGHIQQAPRHVERASFSTIRTGLFGLVELETFLECEALQMLEARSQREEASCFVNETDFTV